MSLVTLALVLSAAGVLVTAALAGVFLYDTETGLRQTTHRAEDLPKVMTDRYIAMAALALGATLYGDLNVIAFLFAAFAFMGFADALIYARGGHPISKHVNAGTAAAIVAVVAGLAQTSNGAA